jgi:hypothetical protein
MSSPLANSPLDDKPIRQGLRVNTSIKIWIVVSFVEKHAILPKSRQVWRQINSSSRNIMVAQN